MIKKLILGLGASVPILASPALKAEPTSQAQSGGFLEDARFTGLYKNFFFHRNFLNEPATKQNYAKEWVHGVMLNFESGYTTGTVGMGFDLQGFYSQRLDSGRGQAGGGLGLFPYKKGTDPKHAYGRVNAAIKARVSKTTLKYGDMYPNTPVFGTANNRLWPQTSTGFQLLSNEIDHTTLELGYFTAKNARTSSHHHGKIGFWNLKAINPYTGKRIYADNVKYMGVTYQPNQDLRLMYYGSRFKDVYQQHYAEVAYNHKLNQASTWSTTANLYRTLASKHDKAGKINNTTWSIKNSISYHNHKFTASYQQSNGNQPLPYEGAYPGEYSFKWLASVSMYNDFDAANEKSAQIRYDYNFKDLGLPGLTFMTRYTKGWDADYTHNNAYRTGTYTGYKYKHWEYNGEFKYVVQTGKAKDLSFHVRYASHRTEKNSPLRDFNEIRIITEYPFDLLSLKNTLSP